MDSIKTQSFLNNMIKPESMHKLKIVHSLEKEHLINAV